MNGSDEEEKNELKRKKRRIHKIHIPRYTKNPMTARMLGMVLFFMLMM
jgi:hypothetical protein